MPPEWLVDRYGRMKPNAAPGQPPTETILVTTGGVPACISSNICDIDGIWRDAGKISDGFATRRTLLSDSAHLLGRGRTGNSSA